MNWSSTEILAGMSAFTAIAAVIIGPYIAARATRSQMLGPMRQAWIDDLRNAVSEFVAKVSTGQVVLSGLVADDPNIRHDAAARRRAHVDQTAILKVKIELLINPKEADHQELVRLVAVAYQAYINETAPGATLRDLTAQTQVVLKKEWNVVKK